MRKFSQAISSTFDEHVQIFHVSLLQSLLIEPALPFLSIFTNRHPFTLEAGLYTFSPLSFAFSQDVKFPSLFTAFQIWVFCALYQVILIHALTLQLTHPTLILVHFQWYLNHNHRKSSANHCNFHCKVEICLNEVYKHFNCTICKFISY